MDLDIFRARFVGGGWLARSRHGWLAGMSCVAWSKQGAFGSNDVMGRSRDTPLSLEGVGHVLSFRIEVLKNRGALRDFNTCWFAFLRPGN